MTNATSQAKFKKGDRVFFINNWDRKGTFAVHGPLTVYSCGKQQMVLHTESGEKFMRRYFSPDGRGFEERVLHAQDMEHGGEMVAKEMAAAWLPEQIAMLQNILRVNIERNGEPTRQQEPGTFFYQQHMAENIAELEAATPKAIFMAGRYRNE